MATENPIPTNMARLADEFRSIVLKLDSKSSLSTPTSNTYCSSMTDTPDSISYEVYEEDYVDTSDPTRIEAINHLRQIAATMNSAGCLHNCIRIYVSERSKRLVIEPLSQIEVRKLDWETLDSRFLRWNQSAIVLVKFLFVDEKRLCDQIFYGLGDATEEDACFIKTVKRAASQLFDNAKTLCYVFPSPEKIFRFLDLFNTLSSLLPIVHDLFSSQSSEIFRVRPDELLSKLAQLIPRILSDFGRDVLQDKSPSCFVFWEIYPLTKYVMSYICMLCDCDYKQTLMALIVSWPDSIEENEAGVLQYDQGQKPLSLNLIWILMQLLSNLEAKAQLYKEASQSEFFMMINADYIVIKIEEIPQLREVIGDGYLMKLTGQLVQVKADYLSFALDSMLYCLRVEGLNGMSGMFTSKVKKMTNRLKAFNDGYEKAQHDLAKLVDPDSLLLVDLQKSISEKLIPAYSSFLEKLMIISGRGKHSAEQHIKYSVEELKTANLVHSRATKITVLDRLTSY